MLGESQRKEPMFYYVRMEEMIPENHLLRLVDKHIDLSFIRSKVKHLYSHTGRPSGLRSRLRFRGGPVLQTSFSLMKTGIPIPRIGCLLRLRGPARQQELKT